MKDEMVEISTHCGYKLSKAKWLWLGSRHCGYDYTKKIRVTNRENVGESSRDEKI